jgi:hypothetical protein
MLKKRRVEAIKASEKLGRYMECSPALASFQTNLCILIQQTKPKLASSLVSSHGFGHAQSLSLCHAILLPQV